MLPEEIFSQLSLWMVTLTPFASNFRIAGAALFGWSRSRFYWSGSGSYSYSYSTVNILLLRDPKYDYDYDYDDYNYGDYDCDYDDYDYDNDNYDYDYDYYDYDYDYDYVLPLFDFTKIWQTFPDEQIKFVRNISELDTKLKKKIFDDLSEIVVCNRLLCDELK